MVVGDGAAITVVGGGGSFDPFTVSFDGTAWLDSLPETTVDNCDPNALALVKLADNTLALVPIPSRCAVIL